MTIVFGCPKCNHVMRAPDEKGGVRVKCQKCGLAMEVPFPKGKLIEVRQTSGSDPGTKKAAPSTPKSDYIPGPSRADQFLDEAEALKEKNDLEGALKILQRALAEVRLTNRMYPIDTFLLLPIYLDLAGKSKDTWQEFNNLLFKGPPNRPTDAVSVALDRHKVLDRMRHFLEKDGQSEVAAVYEAASMVCKGMALHLEDRRRELKQWFSQKNCAAYLEGLKKYQGNLGRLSGIHAIMVDEISQFPVHLTRLLKRVDEALAKG